MTTTDQDPAPIDVEDVILNAGLEGYSIVYGQRGVFCDACGAMIGASGPTGAASDLKDVVLAAVEHSPVCTPEETP